MSEIKPYCYANGCPYPPCEGCEISRLTAELERARQHECSHATGPGNESCAIVAGLEKNAARYEWLREMSNHWNEVSENEWWCNTVGPVSITVKKVAEEKFVAEVVPYNSEPDNGRYTINLKSKNIEWAKEEAFQHIARIR